MITRHLRFLLATAALAGAALGVAPGAALAAGGDNAAQAVNTRDGSSLFRFAFSVKRVGGEVVDQTNTAVAYASCKECTTVAIAFQVVLVMSDPPTITPTNVAVALNEECDLCTTVASAYQFVYGTGEPIRFTGEGSRRIAAIRRELRALGRGDLTTEELQSRTAELAGELRTVLRTETVTIGRAARGAREEDEADADGASDDDGPDPAPATVDRPGPAPAGGVPEGDEAGAGSRGEQAGSPTTTQPSTTTTTEPSPTTPRTTSTIPSPTPGATTQGAPSATTDSP